KDALEARSAAHGKQHREQRKKLIEKRKQLRDEGNDVTLAGQERHETMLSKASERHARAKAEWANAKTAHHAHKADKDDERQEKLDEKLEKRDEIREEKAAEKAAKQPGKPGPGKKGAP